MRNVSDERCSENQNTYFMVSNFFFLEKRVVYGYNVEMFYRAGWASADTMTYEQMTLGT
jgi:hypothetical protein